jgi:hypothetical protein
MATYYVRADGSAADKAAATDDANANTSMNRAIHNGETFSPDDIIVISDAGGEYENTIIPPSSGTLGHEILYNANGSPIINGYELITDWAEHGVTANVWVATWTFPDPRYISVDLSVGTRYASDDLASMDTDGDFAFDTDADEVYLYDDTNDPDTYSSPGVGGNFITNGFAILSGVSYIKVDGIYCRFCQGAAFRADEPGPGITFSNCIGERSYKGFSSGLNGGNNYTDLTIEDCIGRYNTNTGMNPGWRGTNLTVRRNVCHNNGNDFHEPWTSGIKTFDNIDGIFSGYDCYENECYANGYDDGAPKQGDGAGIWLDATQGPTGANKIHHNYIHDNIGVGIFLEICKNSQAYGNVLHDNGSTLPVGQSGANIVIDTRLDFISENNLVYNNTISGGQRGIKVDAYAVDNCELNNNIVKNNICVGFSEVALFCDNGGDNDGVHGSGNIYESNCFGAEDTDFLHWDFTKYSTYDAWLAASLQADNNVESDPSFADAGSDDYTLASDSPCINTGATDLGSPFNEALLPSSTWPDGVITVDQDDY